MNRAIVQSHNDLFNHKLKAKGITDQKGSGRCWLFAAMNIMRPAVIEKYKLDDFEFSIAYMSFWDKLEKANFFLETMIDFRDRDFTGPRIRLLCQGSDQSTAAGGFSSVALIEKYGVMPKEAMPETFPSEHTGTMNRILETKLRIDATELRRMAAEKKSLPRDARGEAENAGRHLPHPGDELRPTADGVHLPLCRQGQEDQRVEEVYAAELLQGMGGGRSVAICPVGQRPDTALWKALPHEAGAKHRRVRPRCITSTCRSTCSKAWSPSRSSTIKRSSSLATPAEIWTSRAGSCRRGCTISARSTASI